MSCHVHLPFHFPLVAFQATYRLEDLGDPHQYPSAAETDRIIDVVCLEEKAQPKRVLVCAPSNAAIDEILRRIVAVGIYNSEGQLYKPNVVRVGPNVHPALQVTVT
jgi:hypothetical protein